MNVDAPYWNRGIDQVPVTTGAGLVMDATDIEQRCAELGLALPFGNVLDVGCGTGRIARLCQAYTGVDISQDAVDYCNRDGLDVSLIDGPDDLPVDTFELITCLSVFTHVAAPVRLAYLQAFATRTFSLLVDILPGVDGGQVEAMHTPPEAFRRVLADTGWTVRSETEHVTAHHFRHRYFWVTR